MRGSRGEYVHDIHLGNWKMLQVFKSLVFSLGDSQKTWSFIFLLFPSYFKEHISHILFTLNSRKNNSRWIMT